jgi:hypothetical protein
MIRSLLISILLGLALTACSESGTETSTTEKAMDATKEAADATVEMGKDAAEATKDATGKAIEYSGDKMQQAGEAMSDTGESMQSSEQPFSFFGVPGAAREPGVCLASQTAAGFLWTIARFSDWRTCDRCR